MFSKVNAKTLMILMSSLTVFSQGAVAAGVILPPFQPHGSMTITPSSGLVSFTPPAGVSMIEVIAVGGGGGGGGGYTCGEPGSVLNAGGGGGGTGAFVDQGIAVDPRNPVPLYATAGGGGREGDAIDGSACNGSSGSRSGSEGFPSIVSQYPFFADFIPSLAKAAGGRGGHGVSLRADGSFAPLGDGKGGAGGLTSNSSHPEWSGTAGGDSLGANQPAGYGAIFTNYTNPVPRTGGGGAGGYAYGSTASKGQDGYIIILW